MTYSHVALIHLSRMHFPICIGRTSLFHILELLGGIIHFYLNSNGALCGQTEEMRRLIWVFAVCPCPSKRTLGLHRLTQSVIISVCCVL